MIESTLDLSTLILDSIKINKSKYMIALIYPLKVAAEVSVSRTDVKAEKLMFFWNNESLQS